MAKRSNVYQCKNCGYEMVGFLGKCPQCNEFGTMEIVQTDMPKENKQKLESVPTKLIDVDATNSERIKTNISEFDRVMGGGIVRDSVTILTAKPGAGKSTLLLQVANLLAAQGLKVLYASGEESSSQIKSRALRILDNINENLFVVSDNRLDEIIETVKKIDAQFVIVDSIQTFTVEEALPSRAGSPTQTMGCAYELVKLAKESKKPRVVFIVGQMTKEDELAGVRALEHLVDCVLMIEGESGEELRSLISTKNRYGSTGEIGFFSMTEKGMISIDNPSEFFMTKRSQDDNVSGSALTVVKEGTRPIILEIESLVSHSFTPYPSRISDTLKRDQLNTLISVLEQRGGINLYDKNVVIKTTGGIKLKDQASNLATIISIASSCHGIPIDTDTVFLADVGLTGELKKIPSLEPRLKEAERMGIKKAYVADEVKIYTKFNSLKIIKRKLLKDVLNDFFK